MPIIIHAGATDRNLAVADSFGGRSDGNPGTLTANIFHLDLE
jgi:hypothetical protein